MSESISKFGHGGARDNSGGARPGAGRPWKIDREPDPADPAPDVERWYVVRTVYGQTDLADWEIRQAGFEVLTARLCRPATAAHRSASGSLIRAMEERFDPLFVRYIIVRMNLAHPAWKRILEMDSVERIISGGHLTNNGIGVPIAIPDRAIERLRQILSPAGVYYPPGYRQPFGVGDPIDAGTAVRMQDGLLAEYAGICSQSDGKRIEMLMGWFGRDSVPTHARQSAVRPV